MMIQYPVVADRRGRVCLNIQQIVKSFCFYIFLVKLIKFCILSHPVRFLVTKSLFNNMRDPLGLFFWELHNCKEKEKAFVLQKVILAKK